MISLITTVYNDEKEVQTFIENILTQTKSPDEFIVVDGGSTDHTLDIINKYETKVKVIRNGRLNIAQGLNLGIRDSLYDTVVICLVGVVYGPDWFEQITRPFQTNTEIGIVGTYYSYIVHNKISSAYKSIIEYKERSKANFLPSSRSIAFRKYVWQKIGGYFENFSYAGEDTQFIKEAIKKNINIHIVDNELCMWSLPSTYSTILKHKKSYIIADKEMNLKKSYYMRRIILFLAFTIMAILISALNLFVGLALFPIAYIFLVIRNWYNGGGMNYQIINLKLLFLYLEFIYYIKTKGKIKY